MLSNDVFVWAGYDIIQTRYIEDCIGARVVSIYRFLTEICRHKGQLRWLTKMGFTKVIGLDLIVNTFFYIVFNAEQWFRIQKCWCRPNFIKVKDAQRKIKHLAWARCWLSWSMSLREFKTFMNLGGPAGSLGSRKAATRLYMACRDEILFSRRAILFYSRRQLNQNG